MWRTLRFTLQFQFVDTMFMFCWCEEFPWHSKESIVCWDLIFHSITVTDTHFCYIYTNPAASLLIWHMKEISLCSISSCITHMWISLESCNDFSIFLRVGGWTDWLLKSDFLDCPEEQNKANIRQIKWWKFSRRWESICCDVRCCKEYCTVCDRCDSCLCDGPTLCKQQSVPP